MVIFGKVIPLGDLTMGASQIASITEVQHNNL